MMTFEQILNAILPLFPNATFSEDSDGELVIHTKMCAPGGDPEIFVDMEQ